MGRRKGPRVRKLREGTTPRIRSVIGNLYFRPAEHLQELKLDRKFFSSLSPDTRILELGAGSGRLANHLLKVSRLKPRNYDLMDIAYGEQPPWMKRDIYKLAKKGGIKLIEGDMHSKKMPANTYDHILIPRAFFPSISAEKYKAFETGERRKFPERERYSWVAMKGCASLKELTCWLKETLKPGGTIRVSFIESQTATYVKENAQRLFPEFDVTAMRNSVIFELK